MQLEGVRVRVLGLQGLEFTLLLPSCPEMCLFWIPRLFGDAAAQHQPLF